MAGRQAFNYLGMLLLLMSLCGPTSPAEYLTTYYGAPTDGCP
jgi:hypothetical protein